MFLQGVSNCKSVPKRLVIEHTLIIIEGITCKLGKSDFVVNLNEKKKPNIT